MTDLRTFDGGLSEAQALLVQRLLRRGLTGQTLEGVAAVPAGTRVPLSPSQARIWFFTRLFPHSAEYNVFETLRLDTAPDERQLDAALRALIARHDALRLRVLEVEGEPVQEECLDVSPIVTWHDLRAYGPEEAERRATAIGSESARMPLRCDEAPLFRVSALRMPGGAAILVFVFHHLVVDYWSTVLFLEELSALLGGESLAAPPAVRFVDYLAWQHATTDERRIAHDLEYWMRKLDGELPLLDLPKDRPRAAITSRRGRAVPCVVALDLMQRLRALADRERTTLFVILLAAYKALLLRLTGQTDIVVGTPLAGRDHPAIESVVGCFVKTVALRTSLGGELTFRELVQRVHATTLEAQDHQAVPLDRVVAELRIPRELNHDPVFQTFFGVQSSAMHRCRGGELGVLMLENDTAKWDLTVSLTQTAKGLSGFIEYSADLFEESTVQRFVAMYVRLLSSVVANPGQFIRAYPLLSDGEREHILHGLNRYERPRHPYRTMAEPFEEQVARTPDAIALAGDEGTLTYAELNDRANRLAHFLRAAGAARGSFVALCMERGFDMIVALYAVAKSGAAYLPLDPELPDGRIAFMLEDVSPAIVIADALSRGRIPPGPWEVVPIGEAFRWSAMPIANPVNEGPTHHLVHLLYTSGSTGRPKGVAYPVDGAIADIFWLQRSYPFHPGDANLFKTSYGFDVSIWEIFWPLYFGARLIVCRPGGHRDPRYLVEMIERYGVTTIFLIPTMMQVFLEELPAGSCRSLRWVFCGGEPVTPRIRDGFFARLDANLINCYGPTEAGCVTDMVLQRDDGNPVVPLGRPAANFRLYVLDEDLAPVPIGVPGEVYIGGEVGIAQCYFRRPELTAERFVPDPFAEPGARMYRTGDICRYREDGVLEHLGRSGRQVKVRGMRVELAEIETVLCEHETVVACVVVPLSEGGQRLIAFVVPRDGRAIAPRDVIEHAARLLPRFMVPYAVVAVSHIPDNVNGKTDRDALLRQWDGTAAPVERELVAPEGEQEQRLLSIFEQILGTSGISVTDSFFELGGHSLLVFKLIAACAQELHVRPTVADVFSAPTVRELAARMSSSPGDPNASLVPLGPKPGKRLLVFVHAASGSVLPFFEVARRLDDFSTYGLQSPEGDDAAAAAQSVHDLAARYVEAVDAVRGMSPVILAGWSMGGCVALEMAQRWRARGVDVAAVLMLDTWIPPAVLASPAEQAALRRTILDLDVLGLEGFSAEELDETPDAIARLSRVLDRNRVAFLDYDAPWFDGEVDLLRAAEAFPDPTARFPDEYALSDRGWHRRIRGVRVRAIAGNHFTLIAKENAGALASAIREIVDARLAYTEI